MQGVTNPVGPSLLYCMQHIPLLCDYVYYFFISSKFLLPTNAPFIKHIKC